MAFTLKRTVATWNERDTDQCESFDLTSLPQCTYKYQEGVYEMATKRASGRWKRARPTISLSLDPITIERLHLLVESYPERYPCMSVVVDEAVAGFATWAPDKAEGE